MAMMWCWIGTCIWPLMCSILLQKSSVASASSLPHILFVIADDVGWGNVGFHQQDADRHSTPHIDALVSEGLALHRHYVHMTCTPSRASFQSGRLPVHILTELAMPCDINGAIPRNMTGIAAVLKGAGYATHHVGKWDAGMTTPFHTPHGRGYATSLNYFGHGNWMWTQKVWMGSTSFEQEIPSAVVPAEGGSDIVDLWDTDRPATDLNGTGYEEDIFMARLTRILQNHNGSTPLFLQYDSRLVHYPLQVPLEYQRRFAAVGFDNRRMYQAMVSLLDDQLKNLTQTMRQLGMWDNTLMIFTTDNGGYVMAPNGECNTTLPVSSKQEAASPTPHPGRRSASDVGHGTTCFNGEAGASNWPLRGGKYTGFEGGIRGTAFVSGGFLPENVRGGRIDEMMHIADWYATLCEGLAGLDPTDHWAAKSGLPPIDSLNMWPLLSGHQQRSPRTSILVNKDILIKDQWKYVRGDVILVGAAHGGPLYPNTSTRLDPIINHTLVCPPQGCLFNVAADPSELLEVSAQHMMLVAELRMELDRQAGSIWAAEHGEDPACLEAARSFYGGYYGPFQEVPGLLLPMPSAVRAAIGFFSVNVVGVTVLTLALILCLS